MKKLLSLLIMGLGIAGCADKQPADNGLTFQFEGRSINIAPYFEEFPYTYFNVNKEGDKLIFFQTGNKQKLQWINIEPGADIRNAHDVTDLDFTKRNCWSPTYNAADSYFYWIGDEKNDEIINLYRTKAGSNEVSKLTDVPYIYAWSFNPEGTKVAYVGRMEQGETTRRDELHVLNLQTLKDSLICEDADPYRYTWGDVSWQPEGKGLMLLAVKNYDRTYTNVLYLDFATGKTTVLTDPVKPASLSGVMVFSDWYSNDEALFLSDQDGYQNLYSFKLSTGKTEQITNYTMNIDKADFITLDGKKYVLAMQSNPIESKLIMIDPSTRQVVSQISSELALSLGAVKDNTAILTAGGTTTLFKVLKAVCTTSSISLEPIMDTPADLQQKLVHSSVERLEIPTFDIDPATGKQRLIHVYLFTPDNPLPTDRSLLMVEAFYGGMNSYSPDYQIYTQAGIYVLSAAPRGSAGFGRDFASLNDKDLGGNETIDMIYVSKYVAGKLNIPAERVGVFGMSHGGYETMRLITFPGEVNGQQASFPFGFGIEAAGFCDIIWQQYHSNIPDWITLEAGDVKNPTDSIRMVERSPINDADKITGPLLLIHGTSDNRVDIAGSADMADKLEALGKPYKFVKMEGSGHGFKGTENNKVFYGEVFDFIERQVLHKN
ncbi:alpha/beta hydrolase family protein [Bacteroides zoogleoformans]|uniref:alpha/beta hydrolase family protein n=1 Tax=Bacteroides zoogleoformans TaxID=28119 RepID=UPI00248D9CD3|nr:prolyl oligopeptidase family serine peptidase [Bacteroides zoogleoformans]